MANGDDHGAVSISMREEEDVASRITLQELGMLDVVNVAHAAVDD